MEASRAHPSQLRGLIDCVVGLGDQVVQAEVVGQLLQRLIVVHLPGIQGSPPHDGHGGPSREPEIIIDDL